MKHLISHRYVLFFSILILFSSCDKNDSFEPGGGMLPTRYVTIRDTAIVPSLLTISLGNSITFLNQASAPRRVISQDNRTIVSPLIGRDSSYFWKKDTIGTFYIHLVEKPSITSTIQIVP